MACSSDNVLRTYPLAPQVWFSGFDFPPGKQQKANNRIRTGTSLALFRALADRLRG
jgi:hypothetical protein